MLLMIAANAQGRLQITEEEARFHTQLQASVAIRDATRNRDPFLRLCGAKCGATIKMGIIQIVALQPSKQLATQLVFRLSRP
ncbi:hypothetical protein [Bradyrhizobium sp.]|uniref:hypothetical protein n=1 Tax=Bradyrhizobium sp. TaxID=376 RepID=UPI0025BE1596|nr:hypothetical protein [Bradyrhizobium sp.]